LISFANLLGSKYELPDTCDNDRSDKNTIYKFIIPNEFLRDVNEKKDIKNKASMLARSFEKFCKGKIDESQFACFSKKHNLTYETEPVLYLAYYYSYAFM
jgi:hypothetical protein